MPGLRRLYRANLGNGDYPDGAALDFRDVISQQDASMLEVTEESEACLVSSRQSTLGGVNSWWSGVAPDVNQHLPAIDLDFPCSLRESSPGRFHLFMDRAMSWEQYAALLGAFFNAGLIERGFYDSSLARGASYLRVAPRGERETVFWDRPVNPQDPFVTSVQAEPWEMGDDGVVRQVAQAEWREPFRPMPSSPAVREQLADIENDLDDIWGVLSRLESANERATCRCAGCDSEGAGQADPSARWSAAPERRPSWQPEARPVARSGSADAGAGYRLQYAPRPWNSYAPMARDGAGSGGDSGDARGEVNALDALGMDGNR